MTRTVLSLFDASGAWSLPYRRRGYVTIQVDLAHPPGETIIRDEYGSNVLLGMDVRDLLQGDWLARLHPCRGILAAPPCTALAGCGAQYWRAKDANGQTAAALALVDAVVEIVARMQPVWWVLENPVGRLQTLRPALGAPWYFQPHWYGDPYTKKTGLWGDFDRDLPRNNVKPIRVTKQGSWVQKLGGKSARTKYLRSCTPPGFAEAFACANP